MWLYVEGVITQQEKLCWVFWASESSSMKLFGHKCSWKRIWAGKPLCPTWESSTVSRTGSLWQTHLWNSLWARPFGIVDDVNGSHKGKGGFWMSDCLQDGAFIIYPTCFCCWLMLNILILVGSSAFIGCQVPRKSLWGSLGISIYFPSFHACRSFSVPLTISFWLVAKPKGWISALCTFFPQPVRSLLTASDPLSEMFLAAFLSKIRFWTR